MSIQIALHHQTRYRYNGQGLLTERIDAIGQTVRYRYDTENRPVAEDVASG